MMDSQSQWRVFSFIIPNRGRYAKKNQEKLATQTLLWSIEKSLNHLNPRFGSWPTTGSDRKSTWMSHFVKFWSKKIPDQKWKWYSRQVVLHILDVKMHVDYGSSIRWTEKLLKTALIGFLFFILSFITLKVKVFPVTSGYRPWLKPKI